ncbi:MAG: SLATT domain-containing protein, partial [Calditrichota bacterium]
KKLTRMQWMIFLLAGFGTLLAAFGLEIWIAVTTAIAVAIGTKLQFDQVEESLMIYNQAGTDLENVIEWWEALSPLQRKQRRYFNKMVETTEQILEGETKGWSQNMTDALAKLRETQHEDGFMGSLEHAVENYKDERARGNLIQQMANLIKTIPDQEKKAQLATAMKDVLDSAVDEPVPDPLEEEE